MNNLSCQAAMDTVSHSTKVSLPKPAKKKTPPRDFPQDNVQILTDPLSLKLVELIFPQFS
jgi:hypothetical protein